MKITNLNFSVELVESTHIMKLSAHWYYIQRADSSKHQWHSFIIDFILRKKRTYIHIYIYTSILIRTILCKIIRLLLHENRPNIIALYVPVSITTTSAFDIHLLLFSPLHNVSDARVVLSFKCKWNRQHYPLLVDHAQYIKSNKLSWY